MNVIVSIIVPVYNAGNELKRLVDSVLAQTFADFELLLIDDGSTNPDTVALIDDLEKTDPRIHVLHQQNQGLYKTCDIGMELAAGEYVYVSGQDDYLHPQLVEICYSQCKRYDLDYLALRWKNVSIKDIPSFPMYDRIDDACLEIIDNSNDDGNGFSAAIRSVHIDAWSQFIRRTLSVIVPAAEFGQCGKTMKCVCDSCRWGIVHLPLFFYSVDNGASIMHKPIHPDWINELGCEIVGIYDVTYCHKVDVKKWLRHRAICKYHVAPGLRCLFNLIKKRPNRRFSDGVALWRVFGGIVAALLLHRRVSIWDIGFRRSIKYLAVAVIFGGVFSSCQRGLKFYGSSKDIK